MSSFRKPSKDSPADDRAGTCGPGKPREAGGRTGDICRTWEERCTGQGPPQRPLPREVTGVARLGPGLTGLGEEVLDLGNGGVGLHLREAGAAKKSG